MVSIKGKNIFGTKDLTAEEFYLIAEKAKEYKELSKNQDKKINVLRGRTIINVFFENSTRTRISFELAGKRLGADVINMSVSSSSLKKGESLMDTAKTLDAMNTDLYVIRHSVAGTCKIFSSFVRGCVINAGDGANEHPTQGILDVFTIYEKLGYIKGLKVAIVGDALHSRVLRSNVYLLKTLGAEVTIVGPETLVPSDFKVLGVNITDDFDSIIDKVDVINLLRLQLERQKESYFPTIKEYNHYYGLTKNRLSRAKDNVIIMHPGPMNRGVEIDYDVADSSKQVILDQVENGVAVRMALLSLILGE